MPAPFPAPRSPASSLWPRRPHAYANLEKGLGPAPWCLLRTKSLPYSHRRYWTGSGWVERIEGVSGQNGKITPERHSRQRGKQIRAEIGAPGRELERNYDLETGQNVRLTEKEPEIKKNRSKRPARILH